MEIKIIQLINLILYSVVVSQSFSYIISITDVVLHMKVPEYIAFRKRTDMNFRLKYRKLIYATLISNTTLLILCSRHYTGLLFITSAIALVVLIADILLAVKGNVPINDLVNTWTENNYPDDWATYRKKWFQIYYKRQALDITGFVCLVVAAFFG